MQPTAPQRAPLAITACLLMAGLVLACGDDGAAGGAAGGVSDADSATPDATTADSTAGDDATTDDTTTDDSRAADPAVVERGRYLVEHVADCGYCHTPLLDDGSRDTSRHLAGRICAVGPRPIPDDLGGCLHSRNLTDHETGLADLSDAEIRELFQEGLRPSGQFLHGDMPFWVFANLTDADAEAVVAYLRTLPGVEHDVPASDPVFYEVKGPADAIDMDAEVPLPATDYPERDAALRGRYLAAAAGACIFCHTPSSFPGTPRPNDMTRVFHGNRGMPAAVFNLASPPYPEKVYTANLTPHETGLAGMSAADIAKAIREGVDRDGEGLCGPMPAGPEGAFGDMTPGDALDIAHFLLSLPPANNPLEGQCTAP